MRSTVPALACSSSPPPPPSPPSSSSAAVADTSSSTRTADSLSTAMFPTLPAPRREHRIPDKYRQPHMGSWSSEQSSAQGPRLGPRPSPRLLSSSSRHVSSTRPAARSASLQCRTLAAVRSSRYLRSMEDSGPAPTAAAEPAAAVPAAAADGASGSVRARSPPPASASVPPRSEATWSGSTGETAGGGPAGTGGAWGSSATMPPPPAAVAPPPRRTSRSDMALRCGRCRSGRVASVRRVV